MLYLDLCRWLFRGAPHASRIAHPQRNVKDFPPGRPGWCLLAVAPVCWWMNSFVCDCKYFHDHANPVQWAGGENGLSMELKLDCAI